MGIAVDKVLCQQGLAIYSHFTAVEALKLVVFWHLRFVNFNIPVGLPSVSGRCAGISSPTCREARESREPRTRRVAKTFVFGRVVEVVAELRDADARENAKHASLMIREFCTSCQFVCIPTMRETKNGIPGGGGRQNSANSSLRKAVTPVKLRWVKRGQ